MTVLGDGDFKDIIQVKLGHKGGTLIQQGLVSLSEEKEMPGVQVQGWKATWGHDEKMEVTWHPIPIPR